MTRLQPVSYPRVAHRFKAFDEHRKRSAWVIQVGLRNQTHHFDFINQSFAILCDLCAFAVEKTNREFFEDGNHNGSAADMEELDFLHLVSSKYTEYTERRQIALGNAAAWKDGFPCWCWGRDWLFSGWI